MNWFYVIGVLLAFGLGALIGAKAAFKKATEDMLEIEKIVTEARAEIKSLRDTIELLKRLNNAGV